MPTDTIMSADPGGFPHFHTETLPPFVFLLPSVPGIPVCGLLWRSINQRNKEGSFSLELIDPISERTFGVSIRCISGRNLDTEWDTTTEFKNLDHSGHPCNTSRPPCLGQTIRTPDMPPQETPARTRIRFWEKIFSGRKRQSCSSSDTKQETVEDTEIPELSLLRASLQLAPDCRAYRIIIEKHFRQDAPETETMFCVTLSFGRCGLGQNMLSIRCQEGDHDGLTIDIR